MTRRRWLLVAALVLVLGSCILSLPCTIPGYIADGTIRFIPSKTDEKLLRNLITRNDGQDVDLSRLD